MTRSNEGRRSDLFSVETETDISRAVLALWNGARNSLRYETVIPLHQRVELLDADLAITYWFPNPAWYYIFISTS